MADQLTADPASNLGLVRSLVAQWLAVQPKITALDCLRHLIISEAYDADVILDLHCDEDALNHIFISPALMPEYQDLADWMGSSATLTAVDSGGSSFDEVWSLLWSRLRDAFPAVPMPPAPLSATLEYRGNFHTFDALNQKDAANLFGFFQQRGWISGQSTQPPPAAPSAQNFAATEYLRVHTTGLLAYQVNNGDRVKTGDVIAELIVLDGDNPFRQRTPVLAGTDGLVFSRRIDKYVWPGCVIAKIAGDRKLDSRGAYLLSD